MNRRKAEDFYGNEILVYNTTMVNTSHYPSAQTQRMYDTKCEL